MAKNREILVLNSSFSIKPVAIRPEMLSNSLIYFPSRNRRAQSILPLCFYTKHPHIPKICDKNPSNFVKSCAIRPEMFSIHFSSRTRRVLSNGHLLSLTSCSWWLQNAKLNSKTPSFRENLSQFSHKCFPTLSFTHPIEVDEFQWVSE